MLKQQFDKPEFWFNPSQIWRRVTFALSGNSSDMTVTLPWGANLKVNSAESIGRSCCTQGIYDLPVTESLFRLISPGDLCVDVGANIGHMTMAMSYCAGSAGAVIAFEPYEPIHARLVENVRTLQNVETRRQAVSSIQGTALLKIPSDFGSNEGTATLAEDGSEAVNSVRVDKAVGEQAIGVLKIDVEGREAQVLEGCGSMLGAAIRDIVFEEFEKFPAETHRILQQHKYSIYRIERTLFGPLLLPPNAPALHPYTAPNFLATMDHARAEQRFSPRGWMAMRRK